LRALSSLYVERRGRLASGSALDGAGKRAAFALFYAPLHFLTVTQIAQSLDADARRIERVIDLGCGTGAAGSAWALACERPATVAGVDRHPWAVDEANRTYRQFGLRGRAVVGDASKPIETRGACGVLLGYLVNELPAEKRTALLGHVEQTITRGATVLVIEPIARSVTTWWTEWTRALEAHGARADEWRFPAVLPALLREIASGAGLDPRELTARSIYVPPRRRVPAIG
jgi:SAM-dependent methyltransferase